MAEIKIEKQCECCYSYDYFTKGYNGVNVCPSCRRTLEKYFKIKAKLMFSSESKDQLQELKL